MFPVINTVDQFIALTKTQPVDWETKPAPNKWSAKQIIGHLIDSAQINLQRFVRCTYEENFKLIYYQDEWMAASHYDKAAINDVLQLWRLLNLQIQRVLDNYPHERWQITCDNSRAGTTQNTVAFLADDYIEHMQHHLNTIIS
jgi:hypothetical protein